MRCPVSGWCSSVSRDPSAAHATPVVKEVSDSE